MSGAGPDPVPLPESWTGERRVTADLDDARPFDAVRAVYTLRDAGAHEVEARVSSSGEGFHVRAWFDAADLDARDVRTLRRLAGDHAVRIDLDETHSRKPRQVLFTSKGDAEAGAWRSDPWRAVDDLLRRSGRHSTGWSL